MNGFLGKITPKTLVTAAFFALTVALTVALGFWIFSVAYEKLFETESKAISELNDAIATSIRHLWMNPIERHLYLSAGGVSAEPRLIEDDAARVRLLEAWKAIAGASPDVYQQYLGDSEGRFLLYPERQVPEGYDPRKRPWYTAALEAPASPVWVKPYRDAISGELVVSVAMTVGNGEPDGSFGVVALDILVSRLKTLLSLIVLPEGGGLHLFHESGVIVLSSETNPDRLAEIMRFTGMDPGSRRPFSKSTGGDDVFYDVVPVGMSGFYSAITVPRESLDSGIGPIRIASATTSLALGALVAALLAYLQIHFRRRMAALCWYFGRVSVDDSRLETLFSGNDEFAVLNSEFNRMIARLRSAEEARIESEREYRDIVETAPIGIYRSTESGRFESANDRLAEILGFESGASLVAEVQAIGDRLYVDPRERERFIEKLKRQGYVTNSVMKNRRRDGEIVWLSVNSRVSRRRAANGECLFDGFITDVTESVRDKELLRELAETDSLTGIRNRRFFLQATERELERRLRYGYSVSLLLLDIDHFKAVNDTWGHEAGDRVLVGLSRIVETCVRHTDLFARYGGEEFVVLMPETPVEAAKATAERIRSRVESELRVAVESDTVRVTVSVGISSAEGAMAVDDLVKRADSAMYAAKNAGRNACRVFVDQGSSHA